MKKMTKGIIVGVVSLGLSAAGSIVGVVTNADGKNWTDDIIQNATSILTSTAEDKKDELLSDSSNISDAMKNALNPQIAEEQQELERLLEEYYQMKVAGLTDTQEFYNVRAQITYIKEKNLKLYKKEIDTYFNEL